MKNSIAKKAITLIVWLFAVAVVGNYYFRRAGHEEHNEHVKTSSDLWRDLKSDFEEEKFENFDELESRIEELIEVTQEEDMREWAEDEQVAAQEAYEDAW
ncbi:hypothetical protein KAU11_00600 [Candidatus Babeliales bacterium]|nr:hypothetical protein [Candidatus Babeliales bacterium]